MSEGYRIEPPTPEERADARKRLDEVMFGDVPQQDWDPVIERLLDEEEA